MMILATLGFGFALVTLIAIYVAANWAPDRPVDALKPRWATPPSKFLTLDGMEVHVQDGGQTDDPTPIVLIHGTGSSLHAWAGWVDRFSDRRRVVGFDRPGFGLTGPNPTGDYSMDYYAGFVGRLLDLLGISRCILVGSSSGGRVAWHLALANPHRVAALVLVGAAGYPRSTPLPLGFRLAQSRLFSGVLEWLLPRSMVERNLQGTYGDASKVKPALVDRNYEITLRAGNRRALGETLRQAAARDDSAAIRQIHVPTLILWGDKDTVVPLADGRRFHEDITGSELVIFPGLGHMPYEEDPEATAAAVEKFLESLGSRNEPAPVLDAEGLDRT